MTPTTVHPHDIGLPAPVVRNRRHAHRVARWMLTVAVVTAIPGWLIFGNSITSALTLKTQSPFQAVVAYAILIISSVTLILGLWYLLLAQVDRIARVVTLDGSPADASPACPSCNASVDSPDRYCRHCGKALH